MGMNYQARKILKNSKELSNQEDITQNQRKVDFELLYKLLDIKPHKSSATPQGLELFEKIKTYIHQVEFEQ